MTTEATLDELLHIRQQIADCRHNKLILTANTLRHKAMSLAEAFVDPEWAAEQEARPAPVLRDSAAMAADIDPTCGF